MKDWVLINITIVLSLVLSLSCVKEEAVESDVNGAEATIHTVSGDSVAHTCDCFTLQDLQTIYDYTWQDGWYSDRAGCRYAPYDQLSEIWLTNTGLPAKNFNYSVQAGTIDGKPFRSSAIYNHLTGQYDLLCGGYTTSAIAAPCVQLLDSFLQDMRTRHPAWDYCVRFPN
jgi:hypothetical protein